MAMEAAVVDNAPQCNDCKVDICHSIPGQKKTFGLEWPRKVINRQSSYYTGKHDVYKRGLSHYLPLTKTLSAIILFCFVLLCNDDLLCCQCKQIQLCLNVYVIKLCMGADK